MIQTAKKKKQQLDLPQIFQNQNLVVDVTNVQNRWKKRNHRHNSLNTYTDEKKNHLIFHKTLNAQNIRTTHIHTQTRSQFMNE